MNTLQQIENLLLPIWNKLYKENPNNIPKSFVKLMTEISPNYLNKDLDLINPKERNSIINIIKNCQDELNRLGISYKYKVVPMPGYYWDDEEQKFRLKKNENN